MNNTRNAAQKKSYSEPEAGTVLPTVTIAMGTPTRIRDMWQSGLPTIYTDLPLLRLVKATHCNNM